MSNSVNLSLDVTKTGIQNPLIKVRQGDGGFETLRTTVTANGEPMDLQGWTITFMGTTAGNHKIVDTNVTLVEAPNGIFYYTPSKAWGMDIGDFKIAYFKFVKGDGSASSANFRVSVIEAVDLTQEEAQNYISVVDTTIAEINQHLTDSLAHVTQSIADANNNANTVAGNVTALGNRVDEYNNKLAAIKVGGRNLLVGTKNFDGEGWTFLGTSLNKSDFQGLTSTSVTNSFYGPKYYNSVLEQQDKIISTSTRYVFSSWVNNTGTTPIGLAFFANDTQTVRQDLGTLPANSGWVHIATNPFNFTKTTGLTGTMRIEPAQNIQGGVFKQAGLKLEVGNIATDWTPAPEDVPSNDAQLVHKTGTETIAGDKTFTGNNKFTSAIDGTLKTRYATFTDFADVAKNMQSYSGNWHITYGNTILNGPKSTMDWTVVNVIIGNGPQTGIIITATYAENIIYYTSVNSGTIQGWHKVADDAQLVHKAGNETIAGDKTFTGKVIADNLVSNSVPVNVTKTTTSKMWYSSTLTAYRTGNTVTIVNNKQDTSVIADNTASTETIPAGYRPSTVLFYPVVYGSSLKGELQINTDGTFTARGAINGQYRVTATYITGDAWPV